MALGGSGPEASARRWTLRSTWSATCTTLRSRARLLRWVAAAELGSEHPLARAVVAHARSETTVEELPGTQVSAARGLGIAGRVDGHDLLFGTNRLLAEHEVRVPDVLGEPRLPTDSEMDGSTGELSVQAKVRPLPFDLDL